MLPSSAEQLRRSMTYRYLLALSIIGILSTAAFYSLMTVLEDSDNTALTINMAGKQRVLTQQIALDIHKIHSGQLHPLDSIKGSSVANRASLIVNIQEMALANQKLSSGTLSESIQNAPSPVLHKMYFGEMDLAQRVTDYLLTAKSMLASASPNESFTILNKIDELSSSLLLDLKKVVSQYQQEGEQKLERPKLLSFLIWIITVLILLLDIAFIFRPMVSQIIASKEAEKKVHKNLNDLFEERTLKLQEANSKLELLAQLDPLTGLRNRLSLEDDIEKLIVGYQNYGEPFAVVMLDIDWFKKINDDHGHAAGDYVLTELAKILSNQVRESDEIYRAGGEEFVLLFNRISLSDALDLVESLCKFIASHVFSFQDSTPIMITVSCGIYHTDHLPVSSAQECLKKADDVMYQSKKNGRNCVTEVNSKTFM